MTKPRIIHDVDDRKTYVVKDFSTEKVKKSIANITSFYHSSGLTLSIGIANLHPKDQYSRKTGVAVANAKEPISVSFVMTSVHPHEKEIIVKYYNEVHDLNLEVKIYRDTGNARIINLSGPRRFIFW